MKNIVSQSKSIFNRRQFIGTGIVGSVLFSAGASFAARTTTTTVTTGPFVIVETANGKLKGGYNRGAIGFKGIPYAGSVSGKNRFKAPPPPENWTGIKDATRLGAPSIQKPNTTYGEFEPDYSEDCLVLNVWTPAVNDNKKRPVLFYCHGGGFATGSGGSTSQDGARFAAEYDCVVVAINHRLGLLGYLYLGDIGGKEFETSGNQGILDIVAALKWVKTNISVFGGDPDNVTISGESGGGGKVGSLMAMPSAKGLFHKACIESGAFTTRWSKEIANETTLRVLKGLGIAPNELHKLYDVPTEQILAIQLAAEQGKGPMTIPSDGFKGTLDNPDFYHTGGFQTWGSYGPVVDGIIQTQHPFSPSVSPLVNNIPLLVGHNRDEATFFNMDKPETFSMDEAALKARLAKEFSGYDTKILNAYKSIYPNASPTELYIAIASARSFGNDTVLAADRKSKQAAAVYRYRYDYSSNYPIKGTNAVLKAGHATDIPAKFYNYDLYGLQGNGEGLKEASKNFSAFFANFARYGKPSAPNQPDWPRYNTKTRPVMLINSVSKLENDPESAARKVWQSGIPD